MLVDEATDVDDAEHERLMAKGRGGVPETGHGGRSAGDPAGGSGRERRGARAPAPVVPPPSPIEVDSARPCGRR